MELEKDMQECPYGLYFSVKNCACEHAFGEDVSVINYCLPTLQLEVPRNQSVKFEALGFVMTRITLREIDGNPNNYFEFNGRNSFINIIRLSNTYQVPQMLLSFDIKVGTFDKRKAHQTVFTNHLGKACNNLPCQGSIQVLLVAQNRLRSIVITKAGKQISLETSISIGWNRVWFVYDGSFSRIFLVMTFEHIGRDFTLKDTAHDHTDVSGPLAPRESGLLVGRPSSDKSGSYFSGGLTNVSLLKTVSLYR
ncbi:hypothetical protein ACJMK2_010951 [Sinanodonta woodiana]|uniref:Uncharacterized protein n=1 Tax=Sinanodonta woodiana TaxID=1069815 RepID=A0ABD3V6D7_SINWO